MNDEAIKLWEPSEARRRETQIAAFMDLLNDRFGTAFSDYDTLWHWSVDNREDFWEAVWDFGGVVGDKGERRLADGDAMPGARFFPDARVNFAENLLRRDGAGDAIVFWGEDKVKRRMSWAELRDAVARLAAALKADGVGPGDRVATYMPNMPETVIGMLATTALGAVW